MDSFGYTEIRANRSYADRTTSIWRPLMPFEVEGLRGRIRLDGLVDTGATETVLPMEVRDQIDPPHRDGEEDYLTSANGTRFPVWYGTVNLRIKLGKQHFSWSAVVAFTDVREQAVLGDAGFMRYFQVTFNRPKRIFTVKKAADLPGTISVPR